MKYVFQVFTGDLSEKSQVSWEEIVRKLTPFYEKGKLKAVLCGWSVDRDFYLKLGKVLKSWNIPMIFKTAVFSEWNLVKDLDPTIDFNGQPMEPYHLNEEENFLFRCPSSEKNRRKVVELYDEKMKDLGFDGIFLDRIRYSSLLGGLESAGGCFCDRCVKIYEDHGIDTERLRKKLKKAAEKRTLPLLGYQNGRWQMEDPNIDRFFKVRTEIILDSVRYFAKACRERGLAIGLDLFTPALGYFAGQDVLSLAEEVDFIKPMLYRYTDAPAGIPFEAKRLRESLGEEAWETFVSACGSMEEDAKEFCEKEIAILKQQAQKVYAGMEVNTVKPIVYMTPERVKEEVKMLKKNGITTMVPSWNLGKMSEECLRVLLEEESISV